jgi:hypothetical protein
MPSPRCLRYDLTCTKGCSIGLVGSLSGCGIIRFVEDDRGNIMSFWVSSSLTVSPAPRTAFFGCHVRVLSRREVIPASSMLPIRTAASASSLSVRSVKYLATISCAVRSVDAARMCVQEITHIILTSQASSPRVSSDLTRNAMVMVRPY